MRRSIAWLSLAALATFGTLGTASANGDSGDSGGDGDSGNSGNSGAEPNASITMTFVAPAGSNDLWQLDFTGEQTYQVFTYEKCTVTEPPSSEVDKYEPSKTRMPARIRLECPRAQQADIAVVTDRAEQYFVVGRGSGATARTPGASCDEIVQNQNASTYEGKARFIGKPGEVLRVQCQKDGANQGWAVLFDRDNAVNHCAYRTGRPTVTVELDSSTSNAVQLPNGLFCSPRKLRKTRNGNRDQWFEPAAPWASMRFTQARYVLEREPCGTVKLNDIALETLSDSEKRIIPFNNVQQRLVLTFTRGDPEPGEACPDHELSLEHLSFR